VPNECRQSQEVARPPRRLAIAQTVCRPLPPLLGQRLCEVIYPWSVASRHSFDFIVRCQTGSVFEGNTGDFPCWPFGVQGYNTFRNWGIALAIVRNGDTIIEVGANTGTETMGFSDIVSATGRVFAFEPVPCNLDRLENNLRLNNTRNVLILPFALGDRRGVASFGLPAKRNSGVGHLDGNAEADNTIQVKIETLDDMADQIGESKLIVMDAEGAEILVLRGGRKYIQKYMPVVVVEAHRRLLDRMGFSLEALYREIVELDYEVFQIATFGLRRIRPRVPLERYQGDWVGVPSGRVQTVKKIRSSLRKCLFLPCIAGLNPMTAGARR